MSKFKIGIVGWKTGDNSFGVTVPYMKFLEYFGEPVILSPTSEINTDLDLLILPGGPDVDPVRYNEAPDYYTSKTCLFREHFDIKHLPEYIKTGIPIFGICRGMQSLGVLFGGKMNQHINHISNKQYERDDTVHAVDIHPKYLPKMRSTLEFNKLSFWVNSIHHQSLVKETIDEGTELEVIGLSNSKKESNREVEVIAHPKLPIVGVQYHPEEIYDDFTISTINYLLTEKKSILA